jgi:hypothetical protein
LEKFKVKLAWSAPSDYMSSEFEKMGMVILSQTQGRGLPLVAWRLPTDETVFAQADQLVVLPNNMRSALGEVQSKAGLVSP